MCAYHLSHGDCKHVLLLPGTVRECYEFAMEALQLAQKLQTLVFLMSDLDLGMNFSPSAPFCPPSEPISPGKVLSVDDVERLGGFERYADVDGDFVFETSARTPPRRQRDLSIDDTSGCTCAQIASAMDVENITFGCPLGVIDGFTGSGGGA